MTNMPFQDIEGYLAVLLLAVVAVAITAGALIVHHLLGEKPRDVSKIKGDVYECGVKPTGDAHQQFSIRYYVVGIVFLIFDVEVVFMYPWILIVKTYRHLEPFMFAEMIFFVVLLFAGYLYLRKRKAFDWD